MRTLLFFLILTTSISTQAQKVWSEWPSLPLKQKSIVWLGEEYILSVPEFNNHFNSLFLYKRDTSLEKIIIVDSLNIDPGTIVNTFIVQAQDCVLVAGVINLTCDVYHLGGVIVVNKHGIAKTKNELPHKFWRPGTDISLIAHMNDIIGSSVSLGSKDRWISLATILRSNEIFAWETPQEDDFYKREPSHIIQDMYDFYFLSDEIPYKSNIFKRNDFQQFGDQPLENWTIDPWKDKHYLVGYKGKSIYFLSDSLTVIKELTSTHEISSIKAINNRVLWYEEEKNNQIKWSMFQDTIRTSILQLNEYIHEVELNLSETGIMVSGYQYKVKERYGRISGANQFYLPIEQLTNDQENDVELISLTYNRSLPIPCRVNFPPDSLKSYEILNPTIIFQNNGTQKLTQFYVGYEYDVGPGFCPGTNNLWLEVNTDLEPGQIDTFSWPSITMPCHVHGSRHFCLYAHTPNHSLDNDFSNNYVCSDFLLSNPTIYADCNIQISPNPTSHSMTISGCPNLHQAFLYNHSGVMVKKITNFKSEVTLSSLPAGMYFLKVENEKGESRYERILLTK